MVFPKIVALGTSDIYYINSCAFQNVTQFSDFSRLFKHLGNGPILGQYPTSPRVRPFAAASRVNFLVFVLAWLLRKGTENLLTFTGNKRLGSQGPVA